MNRRLFGIRQYLCYYRNGLIYAWETLKFIGDLFPIQSSKFAANCGRIFGRREKPTIPGTSKFIALFVKLIRQNVSVLVQCVLT